MRKLAAWAAMIVVAILLVPVVVAAAFAQDAVVIAPASPWDAFWAAIQAPLIAFVTAVLGAVGLAISTVIRRKFGAEADLAFNATYKIAMDAAAGWIAAKVTAGRQMDDGLVEEAVDYATTSYPEVRKIEPRLANIAEDIVAAFGRLKAQ